MKIRRFLFVLVAALALASTIAVAAPPEPLVKVLTSLQALDNDSFQKVVTWAKNGADTVYGPIMDYEHDEISILILDGDQKSAVLQWLRGQGRTELYKLDVTDAQIGPDRAATDAAAATPTPALDLWRKLQYASASLGTPAPDASNVTILKPTGTVRVDGTALGICVSFRNDAPKTAKLVHFDFDLNDASGHDLGHIPFDRVGTFATGIETGIDGENCINKMYPLASLPLLSAKFFTAAVTHVDYGDGTSWSAPSPAP
jgi:hypothetical protein